MKFHVTNALKIENLTRLDVTMVTCPLPFFILGVILELRGACEQT